MSSLYDLPDLFDALFPLTDECLAFYSGLARTGSVLELACGTGQIVTALARLGARATGIDTSAAMLESARKRAAALRVDVEWQQQDMRSFTSHERHAVIIAARNSLLHLHTVDDFVATFDRVRRHLTADGIFAFDVFNPDVRLLARAAGKTYPMMRIATADFGEVSVDETFEYDAATQVGTSHWSIRGHRQWNVTVALRSVFPQELPLLLERGGLVLDARFGDYDRAPFVSSSPRQVCVAHAASASHGVV